jgi:hypothetical protein
MCAPSAIARIGPADAPWAPSFGIHEEPEGQISV